MVKIFISYAHADEGLRQELDKHMAGLKHQGIVEAWHDRRIGAGQDWVDEIDENLRTADVVLLLISSDFIASKYCYDVEMAEAMRRHDAKQAVVIPVILRPCDWHDLPFGKLQASTKDGRAVVKFPTLDDGFLEVVQSIKAAAQRIKPQPGSGGGAVRRPKEEGTKSDRSTPRAPRSSNLGVKKSFTDHDRDAFRIQAFEYIARFFENSLKELEARNPELTTQFRARDANSSRRRYTLMAR